MKRVFLLSGLLLGLICLPLACAVPAQSAVQSPSAISEPTEAAAMQETALTLTMAPIDAAQTAFVPTAPPTPSPTPEPTNTPSPEPTDTPAPTPFSIVWLPDTQQLSYHSPERLKLLGERIQDVLASENVVCVVHTGDIVDNGFKDWQWDNFDLALQAFSDSVPFVPVAGNHDIGVNLGSYKAYVQRPFLDAFSDEQKFEGGKMLCSVLEAGGERILLLGVGWGAGKTTEELAWIDDVMTAYGDLPCILLTHGYLTSQKRILPSCRYLETNIAAKYPNVRLVLSGHSRDYYAMTSVYGEGDSERTVNALMLNKQGAAYCFRVLTFDPILRSISVKTHALDPNYRVTEVPDLGPIDCVLENAY